MRRPPPAPRWTAVPALLLPLLAGLLLATGPRARATTSRRRHGLPVEEGGALAVATDDGERAVRLFGIRLPEPGAPDAGAAPTCPTGPTWATSPENLAWLRTHHVRWVRVFATGHGLPGDRAPRAAAAVAALGWLLDPVEAFNRAHDPAEAVYVLVALTDYYLPGVPGDRHAFGHPVFRAAPVLPAPGSGPASGRSTSTRSTSRAGSPACRTTRSTTGPGSRRSSAASPTARRSSAGSSATS